MYIVIFARAGHVVIQKLVPSEDIRPISAVTRGSSDFVGCGRENMAAVVVLPRSISTYPSIADQDSI